MKKLILVALLALAAVTAHADIEGAPFIPEIDKRFDALEQGNHILSNTYPAGASDSHYIKQSVQVTYNYSTVGSAVGTYSLKKTLPANSIITRSYVYSIVKPTTSASGTLGFYCGNSASPEIVASTAAASYAAAGASIDGTQSGPASDFGYETTGCTLSAKVATGSLTAGVVTLYVDYVVHHN